jgi:hypothetical protein
MFELLLGLVADSSNGNKDGVAGALGAILFICVMVFIISICYNAHEREDKKRIRRDREEEEYQIRIRREEEIHQARLRTIKLEESPYRLDEDGNVVEEE